MPTTLTPAPEACPRPAEWIVFRGRTKRLFLCGGCKAGYLGRGRIMAYANEEEVPVPSSESVTPGRTFYGPPRRCGEAIGD